MTRLGLKIFYLRTRERKLSQQAVADQMGVRQATLSNVERGVSLPSVPLLVELCRFYDVTPTYLLDEARGVVPLRAERWRLRNALATVGAWVEATKNAIVDLGDGKLLCPLGSGESFYDEEARQLRQQDGHLNGSLDELVEFRRREEEDLQRRLDEELQTHPRRRGRFQG